MRMLDELCLNTEVGRKRLTALASISNKFEGELIVEWFETSKKSLTESMMLATDTNMIYRLQGALLVISDFLEAIRAADKLSIQQLAGAKKPETV